MEKNKSSKKINKKYNPILRYLKAPWIMAVILMILTGYIATKDRIAGVVLGCTTLFYILVWLVLYLYFKPRIMQSMVQFASNYAQVQKHLLEDLELPYGLIDSTGRILWFNKALNMLTGNQNLSFKNINTLFEDINEEQYIFEGESNIKEIAYEGKSYRVEFNKIAVEEALMTSQALDVQSDEEYLLAVYMFDITQIRQLEKENYETRMVAGLIYIDNYEEALQSVEEVRQSLLVALIDRKINKYFSAMDAIVRKLEKDKYFVAIKQKYVSQLQSNKFSILDEVKNVNIGNEMALTISIGLGICGHDYAKACEYASVAIDLALGRGGDQATVKDGEKIYFYGGKSKSVEKNTRVKARVKAHALRELLATKDKVIVMGHAIGDIDSFGAAIGIYRAAKTISKRTYIVINEVTASLKPVIELFEQSGEYEEDLFIKNEQAKELLDDNTAVIVVDTSRPSRVEYPELLNRTKALVVLDHHRQSSDVIENASLSYIEPYASSACEMVTEILQYIHDGIRIKPIEADALYGGIMQDTNNFSNKTGVRTFEAAAFLKKNGADVIRVKKMFMDDLDEYKAKAATVSRTEVFDEKFAITYCDAGALESPTVVAAQAANELLNIKGIKASFVFTEYEGKIFISARSMDEINVQLIMEKFGGGGHMNMAGAQLENISLSEAMYIVKDTVRTMIAEKEI